MPITATDGQGYGVAEPHCHVVDQSLREKDNCHRIEATGRDVRQVQSTAGRYFSRSAISEGDAVKILRKSLPTAPRLDLLDRPFRYGLECALRQICENLSIHETAALKFDRNERCGADFPQFFVSIIHLFT